MEEFENSTSYYNNTSLNGIAWGGTVAGRLVYVLTHKKTNCDI